MLLWVLAEGIPAAAYMDDWATPHPTCEGTLAQIDALETIITRPGFRFNAAKRQCGQRVIHLGLLVDTVDMSLGFDRSNSAVTRDTLIVYLRTMTEGQNISHALARRMAGKLGWHTQALQVGRTHIRAWWLYVSFGLNLWHPVRTVLISDTVWWIGVFNTWAVSERPPQRFPILSGAVFHADPSRLQILVSDAAGDDGMGYYFGALGSDAPEYRAAPWDARCSFGSSHAGELSALDHFLHRTQISNCLLLWATDSESGIHSAISGVCKAVDGLALLESSLAICDARQIVLLAFWMPRENNRVAAFLSHLSHIHRSEVSGRFTPAQTHALAGAATGELGPNASAVLAAATLDPLRCALQVFDPAVGNCFLQECTGQVSAR